MRTKWMASLTITGLALAAPTSVRAEETGDKKTAISKNDTASDARMNFLKKRIYERKRLMLLRDTRFTSQVGGARARIIHANEMGGAFRLQTAKYILDGAPILTERKSKKDLANRPVFTLYDDDIVPGEHKLTVMLSYRGKGYGLFDYLGDYAFRITSTYAFTAEEGRTTTVRVVGYVKDDVTSSIQDKASVRYNVSVRPFEISGTPTGVSAASSP